MPFSVPQPGTKQEEEWQELQTVLQSGILDKAPNLKHFLEYVAQQYFSGHTEQLKEYSIAVQALHRLEQFDPQSDTIVRVTAHTLRKKLEQYYTTEGADHPIQIRLPAGKYVLQFERKEQVSAPPVDRAESSPPERPDHVLPAASSPPRKAWVYVAVLGTAALLFFGIYLVRYRRAESSAKRDSLTPKSAVAPAFAEATGAVTDRTIRIRLGEASRPYTDIAGQIWLADRYCTGGSTFSHPNHEIQGTDDPALFQEGREGKLQCRIPAPPGSYQLLLLFADTSGDKEAARQVDLSINNAVTAALDVVDEAGGDNIVVGKVYAGIHPMSDGTIHLDFTSEGSFLNAAEIVPAESDAGATMRMLAGPAIFHDDQGNTWLPERFFQGGRRSFHSDNLPKVANARLFEWERYGHFHYLIPVVAGKNYRLRLYFSEGWFGVGNGGPGGPGSRVFDVYCNGTTLLKDFDILRSQNGGAGVIAFDRVRPTAHGMLELDFTPVKNYPLVDAIEIEPE
jgi:malectin (di-glucose binding ER protein)